MIPKIIHYCWFGRKEKPLDVLHYIATWKTFFPDFEIKEWNESNFDYRKHKYTYEAYKSKKYAFVSDVCRLEALYNDGGIYFDTDIEVVGTFKDFYKFDSFVGYEVNELVGTGVIGANPHQEWIRLLLEEYIDEDFLNYDGTYNTLPNTQRVTRLFEKIDKSLLPEVFPLDVFCAKHWKTKELIVSERTVSIHHYKGSWTDYKVHLFERIERKLCRIMHITNHHIAIRIYKKLFILQYIRQLF